MVKPSSLSRDISPPILRRSSTVPSAITPSENGHKSTQYQAATAADIESGEAQISHHLDYFVKHLQRSIRTNSSPMMSMSHFQNLYKRNQHQHGRHFVVHQHDHPISGVHYDLRLQFSDSSTISFAIPYGLPGNPNSSRPNRMAIETRVHTLWNNLIESASHSTGSLLIWDTGEYEVLPYKDIGNLPATDDEMSNEESDRKPGGRTDGEPLFASFQRRRMRLRLHGTRLPKDYTISMWLPSANERQRQPKKSKRKRRRLDPSLNMSRKAVNSSDSEIEEEQSEEANAGIASDNEEDATIRANNAYTGAENTIGSIHQRNWILTLDRKNSGFHRSKIKNDDGQWIGDWYPFVVRGRDYERSVVTGRNADEVMEDEGVQQFVGRKMWRPIL